jgi:hypothetical protein
VDQVVLGSGPHSGSFATFAAIHRALSFVINPQARRPILQALFYDTKHLAK